MGINVTAVTGGYVSVLWRGEEAGGEILEGNGRLGCGESTVSLSEKS